MYLLYNKKLTCIDELIFGSTFIWCKFHIHEYCIYKIYQRSKFGGGGYTNCRFLTAKPTERYPQCGRLLEGTRRDLNSKVQGTRNFRQVRTAMSVIPYILCVGLCWFGDCIFWRGYSLLYSLREHGYMEILARYKLRSSTRVLLG